MLRVRTTSEIGDQLFQTVNIFSPKNKQITRMNSWSPPPTPQNEKRRKSTGCIGYQRFNLKKIFCDFITTDFDRKLTEQTINMRKASKKLMSLLYTRNKQIPTYTNNAIYNLIILILSDGEKYLTKQKVKHNIHFYLKMAEKALKENDHQTALLIKIVLNNHNITRLNIKYNKGEQKIIDSLNKRYGGYNDCHGKHIQEILDRHTECWGSGRTCSTEINTDYIPSAMILHMHTSRNKEIGKAMSTLGNYPKKLLEKSEQIELVKKEYYKAFCGTKDAEFTKLYSNKPDELIIVKNVTDKDKPNVNQALFNLSCNVKNVKRNQIQKSNLRRIKANKISSI